MGHYDECREGYCPKCGQSPGTKCGCYEKENIRKQTIEYIYRDLQKRSLDTVLADILLDPTEYKKKAARVK